MKMKKLSFFISVLVFLLFFACSAKNKEGYKTETISDAEAKQLDTAYFASGCFWCTEAVFERVKGVKDVVSGYSGGSEKNPTYKAVSAGKTGHAESVRVAYNPEVISYEELVEIFFGSHDPTQLNRQGPDVGKQYRSAIFYETTQQKSIAEKVMKRLNNSGKYDKPIVTRVTKFSAFYKAEDYHQNYYELNPNVPYIISVSRPKVEKFMKEYKDKLKEKYM